MKTTPNYLYSIPSEYSEQAGRIVQETPENIEFFLTDALGNVRQLASGTAPDAKVMLTREYSPYGEIVSQLGTGKTEYGFTGELQDGGLVHLRARDYAVGIAHLLHTSLDSGRITPFTYPYI